MKVRFFTGLDDVHNARHFDSAFISVHRLVRRASAFPVNDWIMDSGAFSTILKNGGYPQKVECYADQVKRWAKNGNLLAAVSQDYMCEPQMVAITGLTVEIHQRLTRIRYDELISLDAGGVYIMPVIQGYQPSEYQTHVKMYGDRLKHGAWVGVGSVCKRNGTPKSVAAVLLAIKEIRPDLRLHGFGIKKTALANGLVNELLYSADSMAWSYGARREGRDHHDWREAMAWTNEINSRPSQRQLFI